MTQHPPHRRGRARLLAALLALALSAGCTSEATPTPPAGDRPRGTAPVAGAGGVEHGRTTVTTADDATEVQLSNPDLNRAATRDLARWWTDGAVTGTPVEISLPENTESTTGRVKLERTYAAPLPRGATATWMYYNPDLGGWVAVPSRISKDRTRVSAQVDHLSIWTDLVSGTQDAVTTFTDALTDAGAAVQQVATDVTGAVTDAGQAVTDFLTDPDQIYFAVAGLISTRADAPTCQGEVPDWVDETTYIADNPANPVRWCVGSDPKQPDLLVVKARVNRGYGYGYSTTAEPTWSWNSTFDRGAFANALKALSNIDETVGRAAYEIALGANMVGPGEEIVFGFSEDAVRSRQDDTAPLVDLTLPNPIGMLLSTAGTLTSKQLGLRGDGWIAATVTLASCAGDTADADMSQFATVARAVLTCASGADTQIAQLLAEVLVATNPKLDPRAAGKFAGQAVGRITIVLAIAGPVFATLNYLTETVMGVDAARQLHVFPTVEPGTRVVRLNPFLPSGQLRPGWTVDDATSYDAVDCAQFGDSSPAVSAVSPGTYRCGITADNMHNCWASPAYPGSLLCLATDPGDRSLFQRSADNLLPTPRPRFPQPAAVALEDGSVWSIRNGGAWGGRSDGLVGAYFCVTRCSAYAAADGYNDVLLVDPDKPHEWFGRDGSYWTVALGPLGAGEGEFPPPEVANIARVWFIQSPF